MVAQRMGYIALQVFLAALIMFLCGQVSFHIPFSSVPVTLQSFGALIIPWTFKGRNASGGILLWLFLGLFGLPVFAGMSGGSEVFLSNSGGYLVGMYLITYLIRTAKLTYSSFNFIQVFGLFLLSHFVLSVIGLLWIWVGGFSQIAMATHFNPYVPGIVFKSLMAAVVAVLIRFLDEKREQ